ncbi:MAG: flagellar biosynthetic protein FliO [Micavibrio sp.]|nr:flagellar biosynthetic protein FliO [Micavibrio sp.]
MDDAGGLYEYLRMFAALLFVLGLMGGFALIVKKLGLGGVQAQNITAKKRLKLIESMQIDARRRVVIIQRDDIQHLLMIGANGETVIETDIKPVDNDAHG